MNGLFKFFVFSVIFFGFLNLPTIVYSRTSNDPFVEQWSYEDTGVFRAWDYSIGSRDVVVAVIDNGFDYLHPDLFDNVWRNEDEIADNLIDDDNNGYIDDLWGWNFVIEDVDGDGRITKEEAKGNNDPRPDSNNLDRFDIEDGIIHHGTLVAGIIGAVGNNNKDGVGVNWNVRLMNLKVIDNSGSGSSSRLGEAIRYAVDNGADVINMSIIGDGDSDDLESAVRYAYNKGVTIFSAAGNNNAYLNNSPEYPICVDAGLNKNLIIGVSAIDSDHHLASFSNIGSNCIDITAPGVYVSSTQRFSPTNGLTERYGGGWSGTSFATPFVSGAAALIKSVRPNWNASQIYNALLKTAHHTVGQNEAVYAQLFGAGLLQVDKALEYALSGALGELEAGISSGLLEKTRVMSVSLNGMISTYDFSNDNEVQIFKSAVKDVDDVASYIEDDKRFFVTSKYLLKDRQTEISFYDKDWALVKSWKVFSDGSVEIGIADVAGDNANEIILAPVYSDDQVFRVFDLNGNILGQYSLSGIHAGVSLDFIRSGDEGSIVALYDNGEGLSLHEFDRDFTLTKTNKISFPGQRGVLAVGDIDADGEPEYIIGAKEGEAPHLGYYKRNGELKRLFFAYDPSYNGGLDIDIFDVDNNGYDDVVVASSSGEQPVRIWNYKSNKLNQWWPFGEMSIDRMTILSY